MSFVYFRRYRDLCFVGIISLGICAIAGRSTLADTNLVDNGTWVIDGTDDTGPSPTNITLSVDGHAVSSFSKLNFSYNVGGTGVVSVCTITGSGAIRLSLPPPGVFGGTFFMSGYEDCDNGPIPPMSIVALDIQVKKGKNPEVRLKGQLSNFTSMEAKDFKLDISAPRSDSMSVDVQYSLVALRDICISQTNSDAADTFHVMSMAANYLSTNVQENDEARYLRVTQRICFFYGCVTTKKSFCESLVNTNGFLYDSPKKLGSSILDLVHTQPLPQNTPTLKVQFHSPASNTIKPQGFVNESVDPTDQNVSVWGNWNAAKNEYRNKKKIEKFRYTLSVAPPQDLSCDDSK
jgi:hypothetical protein